MSTSYGAEHRIARQTSNDLGIFIKVVVLFTEVIELCETSILLIMKSPVGAGYAIGELAD